MNVHKNIYHKTEYLEIKIRILNLADLVHNVLDDTGRCISQEEFQCCRVHAILED